MGKPTTPVAPATPRPPMPPAETFDKHLAALRRIGASKEAIDIAEAAKRLAAAK